MKYIIGIDEVGRGALAGPVTVTALMLPRNFKNQNSKIKLKDSKKLSLKQREIWFAWIKENSKIYYSVASVPPKIIDKINISNAANLAATRAFNKLTQKVKTKSCNIFLDGGLYLNGKILNAKTIIRGDEKIPAISLASIVAKVSRDKLMRKLHKKHPRYDFINNVGYGTPKHIKAIKKYGRLPIHRKSFKLK